MRVKIGSLENFRIKSSYFRVKQNPDLYKSIYQIIIFWLIFCRYMLKSFYSDIVLKHLDNFLYNYFYENFFESMNWTIALIFCCKWNDWVRNWREPYFNIVHTLTNQKSCKLMSWDTSFRRHLIKNKKMSQLWSQYTKVRLPCSNLLYAKYI